MVPFAIAGVQMPVAALHDNVPAVTGAVASVVGRFPWVQMLVFSELACSGPVPNRPVALPGLEEAALQAAARKHGVWLVPGSIWERGPDGRIYNTCPVIDPAGTVVARYRKMFPFRPYEKDASAGTEFCVFDVPGIGRFGLSICYDIWFPETTRTLTSMGAEVLIHPVLTPTIDRDVELAIARATAAQFQTYVIDINGVGQGGTGRSCIVDPAGNVLHQAQGEPEIIPLEIDLSVVRRQRATGLKGLGQVLKSFRDREVEFPIYDRTRADELYLQSLGALEMPVRGGTAGLDHGAHATAQGGAHVVGHGTTNGETIRYHVAHPVATPS